MKRQSVFPAASGALVALGLWGLSGVAQIVLVIAGGYVGLVWLIVSCIAFGAEKPMPGAPVVDSEPMAAVVGTLPRPRPSQPRSTEPREDQP